MSYEESSIKSQNLSNRGNIKSHKTHTGLKHSIQSPSESRKQSFKNNSESEDDQSSEYVNTSIDCHVDQRASITSYCYTELCSIHFSSSHILSYNHR